MKHLEVVLWEVPRFHAREGSNLWSRTDSCILHVVWHPNKYSVDKTAVMKGKAAGSLNALDTSPYLECLPYILFLLYKLCINPLTPNDL
jgi:hypothetical protein